MQHNPGWVRQFHKPSSPEHLPLLIFPHAGAGASAYRTFSKAFSDDFEVIVFQYPGRQDRAREPAATSIPDMAAGAFAAFQQSNHNRGLPLTTFGHCMGALVSFEFTQLAEAEGSTVEQLAISAAVAPCRAGLGEPTPQEDEELLDYLAMLEGTSRDVIANPELMKMALPAIKNDHKATDSYAGGESLRTAGRIHALRGTDDPIITMQDLNAWRTHSDEVDITLFDGGHFYLNDNVDAIAELLRPHAQQRRTA